MSDRRRLLSNMASLFTLQGANYLLPLVTLPYLVRVLGPEKFGLIAFAQAFIQYFVVLTDYGFNLSATREVAVHREKPEKLADIVSTVLTLKILFALAGLLLLAALVFTFATFRSHWPLYFIVYLTVLGSTIFPMWLFQGLERMRDITWMNVAARLITTVAIFIFVHHPEDYAVAAAIQSIPVLLAAIPAWTVLRTVHAVSWRMPTFHALKVQIRRGWPLFLSTAAINVYTSSNTFVLGLIAGPGAVGYFSAANKISGAVIGLYQPVNQTLYPHISKLSEHTPGDAIRFIKKIYPLFVLGGLVSTATLFIFAHAIVQIMLGVGYAASISVLEWMAFLPIILAFGHIYGGLTMLPLGLNRLFSRIVLISALIDLAAIYPLVTLYGAKGAAMTTVTAEVCVTTLLLATAKRKRLFSSNGFVIAE